MCYDLIHSVQRPYKAYLGGSEPYSLSGAKTLQRPLREYLGELGLDFSDVGRMDTDDIGREVNKWENNRWRRDI